MIVAMPSGHLTERGPEFRGENRIELTEERPSELFSEDLVGQPGGEIKGCCDASADVQVFLPTDQEHPRADRPR